MQRPLQRITPAMQPGAYKTYQISAPAQTHWRPATCAEVDCPAYLHGWTTTVDESTKLGQGQAYYVRRQSGRGFTEQRGQGGLTVFRFEAGQACFASQTHQMQVRPEHYLIRPGDWRGLGEARQVGSARAWVDDFGEHQERLADRLGQG